MTALGREQQRNENTSGEKRRRMFVFKTEPQQKAQPKPKLWRAAVYNADKQIDASHPEQRLKRVHGKEIANSQKEQRGQRGRAAERDRPSASAQFARDRACERNGRCARQRWEQANRKQRIAKEDLAQS
jgi:hypothetical protein